MDFAAYLWDFLSPEINVPIEFSVNYTVFNKQKQEI